MREEIATFLANDVKDPRIMGLVTVTAVEVTRDLRHAKVFVSVLGSESQRAATFDGLDGVAGTVDEHTGDVPADAASAQLVPHVLLDGVVHG